jgi:hypothetical protein
MRVSTVQEMGEMDMQTIPTWGLPGDLLMEEGGYVVYSAIMRAMNVRGHRCAVFSGPGTNGGEGGVPGDGSRIPEAVPPNPSIPFRRYGDVPRAPKRPDGKARD